MADDSFSFPIDAVDAQQAPAVIRPYKRAFERVAYVIPVEITDRIGSFMIKAKIMDVSPVAAKVQFLRAPRLKRGDKVIVTIWKNIRAEMAVTAFRASATVFASRDKETLVLMFDDPRSLVEEGFAKFIYGPLLLASLNGQHAPDDARKDSSVEALRKVARRNVDMAGDPGTVRAERDTHWRSHGFNRPGSKRRRGR